ncbi:hypothetical protein PV08_11159 [Exophiala spinifera]|uniref:IgE-binding protein n=1 Tax=Exophiala spinifera TaxID=91928 RepID=A0A0D2ATX8_9EURO|nr:uncharacterized protein PV08_11159 [Exophiala spinifera]KIW10198.1 hypothetical protein PV08_11159 [Exophiala spinifera]
MQFFVLTTIALLSSAGLASPRVEEITSLCTKVPSSYEDCGYANSTSSTRRTTISSSIAKPTSTTASSTGVSAITTPTLPITVVAVRGESPVDYLRMNAAGLRFWLGIETLTYCPVEVDQVGGCPPGNETVFSLCSMAVVVAGGQQIYVTRNGEIGYTEAHSAFRPAGSVLCPFRYQKNAQAPFGRLTIDAFGSDGFMACPTEESGIWQVFANMANATVPRGNVSQCLGVDAIAIDSSQLFAAWQYT